MTRRSKLWRIGAALFVFINVGGAIEAAVMGERIHAGVHVGLLLLGAAAYVVWRLAAGARRQNLPRTQQGDERLEYLQQSVDAMALELERLGEKQRFSEKLRAERGESSPPKKLPPEE